MRRALAAGALVLGAAGLLGGCSLLPFSQPTPTPTPTVTAEPSGDGILRIGTLLSSTDPAAAAQVAGVNAAVREINLAGGVNGAPVQVLSRNAGDPGAGAAPAALADLLALGADFIIGPSSPELFESLTPDAEAADVVIVAPGAGTPVVPDAAFAAKVRQEDPGIADPSFAAEAYDATVEAALAATIAGDDGGASIARELAGVTSAGIACGGYGACLDVLTNDFDIAYAGVSSPVPPAQPTPETTSGATDAPEN